MDTLTNIENIENYRIYKNFSMQNNMEFKRINLIYGFNGTGKTTFSEFFQGMRNGDITTNFKIKSKIGDINLKNYKEKLPEIRIFNKNYITRTIPEKPDNISPIYYIGEGESEKSKLLSSIQEDIEKNQKELELLEKSRSEYIEEINSRKTKIARSIKLLLSANKSIYNNYTRQSLSKSIDFMGGRDISNYLLNDIELERLSIRQKETVRDIIDWKSPPKPYFAKIGSHMRDLLNKIPENKTLERLNNDAELSKWVESGYYLHVNKKDKNCQFCCKELDNRILLDLKNHFDESYVKIYQELSQTKSNFERYVQDLNQLILPDKSLFYKELQSRYEKILVMYEEEIIGYKTLYLKIISILENKLLNIKSTDVYAEFMLLMNNDYSKYSGITMFKDLVDEHNEMTVKFEKSINDARKKIESHYVAELIPELLEIENKIDSIKIKIYDLNEENTSLKQMVEKLKVEVLNHAKFSEYLSEDFEIFFNRSDIKFYPKFNGYEILRNGKLAENLSDGERNAIAIIYFLRSLQDINYDINNGIVIIDDPTPYLDQNTFYSACEYIVRNCTDAGQLFILSNSPMFIRESWNWFNTILQDEVELFNIVRLKDTVKIEKTKEILIEKENDKHFIF